MTTRPLPGVFVDLLAVIAITVLGVLHSIEGRDAATAILVIVVGRLRPPTDASAPLFPPAP